MLFFQFRDPFTTSDCLFSLINGDDMFATYKGMSETSTAAYVFCKVYLYVFIALFIYVVLSVFISLISDTYETLHVRTMLVSFTPPPPHLKKNIFVSTSLPSLPTLPSPSPFSFSSPLFLPFLPLLYVQSFYSTGALVRAI